MLIPPWREFEPPGRSAPMPVTCPLALTA